MQRVQLTTQTEPQLVGRVLVSLGLAHASERQRFFQYFHSVAAVRYASHRQQRAYVSGNRQRQALLTAIELGRWAEKAPPAHFR